MTFQTFEVAKRLGIRVDGNALYQHKDSKKDVFPRACYFFNKTCYRRPSFVNGMEVHWKKERPSAIGGRSPRGIDAR